MGWEARRNVAAPAAARRLTEWDEASCTGSASNLYTDGFGRVISAANRAPLLPGSPATGGSGATDGTFFPPPSASNFRPLGGGTKGPDRQFLFRLGKAPARRSRCFPSRKSAGLSNRGGRTTFLLRVVSRMCCRLEAACGADGIAKRRALMAELGGRRSRRARGT